jgi:Spy/CpxP family protein refolding chaperone
MKTKTIALTIAGLGLTTMLMASGLQGDWDEPCGDQRGPGMHQQDDWQRGMHRRGFRGTDNMRRGQRRGFMRRIGRQLDLTREQRQKIREVFKNEHKAKQAERKARWGERQKRSGLFGNLNPQTFMSSDQFDKEAFIKAVQKQALDRRAKREAIRKSRVKHLADFMEKIFNILTPEQRLKWIELAKQ